MDEIVVVNKWFIGIGPGEMVVLMRPPRSLTKSDAVLLAAWLVAITGTTDEEFKKVLEAVRAT